ncbi:MAG: hypothetical protein KDC54_17640, partial [Lewinella sp.]|nr:hypothetical protein [Lewinella sp.]
SFVRKGTVNYVWFAPVTPAGDTLDLNALGAAAGFRKENILPMAERAAYYWEQQDTAAFRRQVTDYWLRYREKLPALKSSDRTAVSFQTISTDPDQWRTPLREEVIGTLQIQSSHWGWHAAEATEEPSPGH